MVATVMSNLGLERFLAGARPARCTAPRSATATWSSGCAPTGFNVGGEQSGHIILADYATTGDGLMAALQVLAVLVEQGRPASETLPRVHAAAAAAAQRALSAVRSPLADAVGAGGDRARREAQLGRQRPAADPPERAPSR